MSSKAIRETLATLGVIASLIFVGIEIRNGTTQARAAAYQALGVATAEWFDSWAHDPDLAAVWNAQPSALDSADWRRWTLKVIALARLGERPFGSRRSKGSCRRTRWTDWATEGGDRSSKIRSTDACGPRSEAASATPSVTTWRRAESRRRSIAAPTRSRLANYSRIVVPQEGHA